MHMHYTPDICIHNIWCVYVCIGGDHAAENRSRRTQERAEEEADDRT